MVFYVKLGHEISGRAIICSIANVYHISIKFAIPLRNGLGSSFEMKLDAAFAAARRNPNSLTLRAVMEL